MNSSLQLTSALAGEENKLLACVHCGLCLEACPTYVHTGDENDGPRVRIYLMRAVEEGRLDATAKSFRRHINRCLGCRACESVCPAGVEYGQLLEAARSDLSRAPVKQSGWTSRLLRFTLRHIWLHPGRLRFAFALARLMRDARLSNLLIKLRLARLLSPRLEFALALLDGSRAGKLRERTRGARTLPSNAAQEVLLFKGCVTEGLFARVNRATARVLEVNDSRVSAPAAQVCCGALHAHAGDLEGARELARRNIDAFDNTEASIVTNAGGCGAMLVSYAHLLAEDPEYSARAREFSARVLDISQQLEKSGVRRGAELNLDVTTYDASCHLLYGQRADTAPLEMLHSIPGLNFVPLAGSEMCCGGAGVYNLLEPELSARVLDEKLAHIEETGARTLSTGNPGCHMQIAAGARLKGIKLARVCHPVELLDESYERAGFYQAATRDDSQKA
ncbi:MAG TPA: heterodisulfide reductase-related iron-sulfur binding cluster, partial [Pyrinomonadaceae bacterium]|nr:heterodisulfide reductase-related iron-sulfur binding cluster [Pyrinomonadaceae bacterium]